MTQSYFKAIIWDNSNYVQEQRRSNWLVPLLDSSVALAKRKSLCLEGTAEGGRERGPGGGRLEEEEEGKQDRAQPGAGASVWD